MKNLAIDDSLFIRNKISDVIIGDTYVLKKSIITGDMLAVYGDRVVKVLTADKSFVRYQISYKNIKTKFLVDNGRLHTNLFLEIFESINKLNTKDEFKITASDGKEYLKKECVYTDDGIHHFSNVIIFKQKLYHKETKKLTLCYISGELIETKRSLKIAGDLVIKDDVIVSHKLFNIKETYNVIEVRDKNNSIIIMPYDDNFIKKEGIYESYKNGVFYVSEKLAKEKAVQKVWTSFRNSTSKYNNCSNYILESKPYTFGVEIETSKGYVPPRIRNKFNWDCTRDMSINAIPNSTNRSTAGSGGEYVTGVLYGDKGIIELSKILNELNKRCEINNTCGVHLHIGNIEFTKQTTVLLYYLLQTLENEIKQMLPVSRRDNSFCRGMKTLHFNFKHCNKDEFDFKIRNYYNTIFKVIAQYDAILYSSSKYNKFLNHPRGHRMGYDKTSPRYWWVNLVPALFNTRNSNGDLRLLKSKRKKFVKSTKNHTIEFRNHSATLDINKVKNWILICMGIVSVAENNIKEIINGKVNTLEDVMNLAYSRNNKNLIQYINDRKVFFQKDENENVEYKTKLQEQCL